MAEDKHPLSGTVEVRIIARGEDGESVDQTSDVFTKDQFQFGIVTLPAMTRRFQERLAQIVTRPVVKKWVEGVIEFP